MVKTGSGKYKGGVVPVPERVVYLQGKEMVKESLVPGDASQLVCSCGTYRTTLANKVPWCAHLKHVYDNGMDARQDLYPISLPSRVGVTVFVSKPPAIAMVGLDEENDIGLQRAWIIVQGYTDQAAYGQHFIGFLSRGAGRSVLRRMILDELTGMTFEQAIEIACTNTAHWKTGLFNKGFDPKDRMQLADILYRIQFGECWTCFTNSSVPEI